VTLLERAQAGDQLRQACETGRVIELTLAPDERAATIRLRYQAVARELGFAVRFQTARYRRYRDWQDMERDEAAVLLVHVRPDGAQGVSANSKPEEDGRSVNPRQRIVVQSFVRCLCRR
jgi:hypothetical protein